jgi:cell division protein FtsN
MVRDLKARGFAADVQTARVGEHLYYRVLVGPPQPIPEAQALLVRLKEAGFEGMLYFP